MNQNKLEKGYGKSFVHDRSFTSGGFKIFLRWGIANFQKLIILGVFFRILHENERIWTPRGRVGYVLTSSDQQTPCNRPYKCSCTHNQIRAKRARRHTFFSSCETYSSFPLIQPSFVKLSQLAQFVKTSHAWLCMELVIVWGTSAYRKLSGPSGRASNI